MVLKVFIYYNMKYPSFILMLYNFYDMNNFFIGT